MIYASVSATTATKQHIITRQTSQRVLLSNSNHEPRRCPAKCPSDISQGRRNLTLPHFFRIYRIQYYSSRFSECSLPTEFTQRKYCMYSLFLPSDRLAKSVVMTWFRLQNHVKIRRVVHLKLQFLWHCYVSHDRNSSV